MKDYSSIIPTKVQDLVSLIIEAKRLEFREALQYLYWTKLYEALSNEETKLWHLSSEKLLDMLETEKLTNELIYPDFV
ncbi:MAG: hypothetical protein KKD31_13170 [Bacteroidetes bacterium]|nr:hypothetical protein [Bacteroidota bacterium]